MRIDGRRCRGCGACRRHCPLLAIRRVRGTARFRVDRDACVECGACLRAGVCLAGALRADRLTGARRLRALFSDPLTVHRGTRVPGRGTEEMKTNDVTGRLPPDRVGVTLELGRPGAGTSFREVERLAARLARRGVRFEPRNPLTALMTEPAMGRLDPKLHHERILSALLEFQCAPGELAPLLAEVRRDAAARKIVLSVGVTVTARGPARPRAARALRSLGLAVRPNGKVNAGLGRTPGGTGARR